MHAPLNVLGTPIKPCSTSPMTGWFREGCCNTDENDRGSHTICCRVTTPFLEYLAERGNDLMSAAPSTGSRASRRRSVVRAQPVGAQPTRPVSLPLWSPRAPHARALSIVPLEELMAHSLGEEA